MFSSEALRAFVALLQNAPTATALPEELQQELILKGIVAALEEMASARSALSLPANGDGGQEEPDSIDPVKLLQSTAARHANQSVRGQALQALLRLALVQDSEAIDAVYRLSVENDLLAARQSIITRGWKPGRPELRALFDWFTTLQTGSAYPEEDLPLLTRAYFGEASPALQGRLLATAAQNRAENWARIVTAVDSGGEEALLELVDRYPSFRPAERDLFLAQLERLAQDGSSPARGALSLLFIRHEDERARRVILENGLLPEDPEQRALFLFLAEAWETYQALDFNHNLLVNAYETAGRSLRRRLLEHSRHTGQMDWLRGAGSASTGGEAVRWLNDLTDADWDLAIRRLVETDKMVDLWHLAQVAPPLWSAQILDRLGRRGWQPENGEEQAGFSILVALARESLSSPLALRPVKTLHAWITEITCLAIHPGGAILAAGGTDQRILQWNLPDGTLHEPELLGPAPVTRTMAFSPDGELLASASGDNRIRIFRRSSGQVIKVLEGHRAMIRALAIHPDGRMLYSAGFDGSIRFWRFPHGMELKTLRPDPGEIFSLVLAENGSHLISAGADSLVRVWTLPDGTISRELPGHTGTITHLSACPASELVASAGRDSTIRVWNITSGGQLRQISTARGSTPGSSGGAITALCLHPNEQVLIGGRNNGEITLWSLSTGRLIDHLPAHHQPITGLILSPDGRILYSADSAGHVQIWDLGTFFTIRLPGDVSRPGAAEALRIETNKSNLPAAEKKWLSFAAELARWRQRFDIALADFEPIQIGEFDIEL